MKKLIYVEGSPRKNRSHSINIANGYLDKVRENDGSIEIKTIDLWSMDLPEFTGDMMDAKYAVIGGTDPSDQQKEEWGKVTKIFDEFADAVFELNNNNYTSLIKTDIGWHVLKVTEIIEIKIKKIDEVKDKIKNNLSLDKAYDELDSLIIEVENNILDGNKLEEISNKLNLELNKFKLI